METCSQCSSNVSEEAKICPTCGHPQFKFGIIMSIIIMLIVIAIGIKFMPRFEYWYMVVGFLGGISYSIAKDMRN